MMRRIALVLALSCAPMAAYAQSAAMPVIPGRLSIAGCPGAENPCFIPDTPDQPLGYQQITVNGTAVSLTVPTGAAAVVVRAETQNIRWRDDGVAPTASTGFLMNSTDAPYVFGGALAALQFINTGSSTSLDVSYYK